MTGATAYQDEQPRESEPAYGDRAESYADQLGQR